MCGPRSLLPNAIDEFGVLIFDRVEEAIEWAEALNVFRLQFERMTAGYIPSAREYNRVFGISRERLDRAKRDILILHPGPMNRGVEIDSDVADGPHSVILDQVTNGVAVRMAVLYLLAGGKPELAEAAKGGSGRGREPGSASEADPSSRWHSGGPFTAPERGRGSPHLRRRNRRISAERSTPPTKRRRSTAMDSSSRRDSSTCTAIFASPDARM